MSSALHLTRVASNDCYDESVPYMGYTGFDRKLLKDSFELSLKTEIGFLKLDQEPESESTITYCCHHANMFVSEIWDYWSKIKNPERADKVADAMKNEFKQLEKFVRQAIEYLSMTNIDVDYFYQCTRPDRTSEHEGEGLCSHCPKYIARQFYLCPVVLEVPEVIQYEWFQIKVKAYRHLWLATLRLYQLMALHRDIESDCIKYNTLLMIPASLGKLYEMTNPVGNAIYDGLMAKKEQFETPPAEHTQEEWDYFNAAWDATQRDLFDEHDTRHNRYMRSWRRAIQYLPTTFQFTENDYFFSPKSSSFKIVGLKTEARKKRRKKSRKQSSYLTSLAELDSLKSDPETVIYDNFIGYHSFYNETYKTEVTGHWSVYTQVLNKGKRKLRGIRMSDNSTQDRCQFLENLDTKWCDRVGTSARTNQRKGYALGQRATQTWYEYHEGIRQDHEHCPSLYNTDFTDATDIVSQQMLWKFNNMMYGHEIADFWLHICQKPFMLKYEGEDHKSHFVECSPKTGNPQGAKKSFTDFHNLHQWLCAMTVRILQDLKNEHPDVFQYAINYESTPVEYMFSVLGDDDGFWSIQDDPVIDDSIFPFYDENMGHGGAMYQVYTWLCKMCNWYFNPDKAQITTPDSQSAVWEFAKVTVFNGVTFTAPPFRMIGSMASSRISHPIVKPFAFALWRVKTMHSDGADYLKYVINRFSDNEEMESFLNKLCFGGFLRSLEDIFDEDLQISCFEDAVITAALIRAQLETGLASQILSEGELDKLDKYTLSELLWDEFDENLYNSLDYPTDHKFNLLLNQHLSLVDLVDQLKLIQNVDDKIVLSFLNLIARRHHISANLERAFDIIVDAFSAIDDILEGIIDESVFIDLMSQIDSRGMDDLSMFTESLITRGTDKRPSVESSIGISAWRSYSQLMSQLRPNEWTLTQSATD